MRLNPVHAFPAAILLAASLALAACQSAPSANRVSDQTGITRAGTAFAAPVEAGFTTSHPFPSARRLDAGGLLKGWADGRIRAAMDEADRAKNQQVEGRATVGPIGQQVTWSNPANGDSGAIIPLRDAYSATGAYCREFRQFVTIGGQRRQGLSRVCQQQDGQWQTVQGNAEYAYK